MDSPFQSFDRIFVVNCDSDVERMSRASERLRRLNLKFERFPALPPWPGLRSPIWRLKPGHFACAASHRALLQLAWESQLDRTLIFEDDVVLRDDAGEWMRRIVTQLDAIPWDVFYLGLRLEEAGDRCGENLLQVRRGFHTHAYAVARQAIPRLMATIDRTLAKLTSVFDGYEDPVLFKVCAHPILAIQEPNHSHTHGVWVDRTADYFAHFDRDDFCRNCREMQSWPQTEEVSSQRAVELLQAGRAAEAQAVCRRALICNPDDAEALHGLGLIAHQAGHSEDALRLIGRAIEIDPRDLRYHVNLAIVLNDIGRPAEAVEPLRAALKLRRNLPEIHFKLGATLETIGRLAESAAAYRDAIVLRPNYLEAQLGLQRVMQSLGSDGGMSG